MPRAQQSGALIRAGQGQPQARLARQPRQEPAAADVREQANAGLGHGEGSPLGGDPHSGRQRQADAAAHGHPVHHRDDRLGIGEQQVVQLVLGMEEPARRHRVARPALGEHADVAAGAESALAAMVDEDALDRFVVAPDRQRIDDVLAHHQGQGVQGLGPVQRDPPDAGLDATEDFGFVGHGVFLRPSRRDPEGSLLRMTQMGGLQNRSSW